MCPNVFRWVSPFSVEDMKVRLGDDVIRCVGYGHVGDGNLHLNITTEEYDKNVMDKIEPFVYEWTARYNGSISAEHGKSIFLTQRINRTAHID